MFKILTGSFKSSNLNRFSTTPKLSFDPSKRSRQTSSEIQKTKKKFKVYKNRLEIEEILNLPSNLSLIKSGWKLIPIQVNENESWALKKTFDTKFKTWGQAIGWMNDQLRPIADECDHHPDVNLNNYNQLHLTLFTHSVGGLTPRDFRLALKIDRLETSGSVL
ncbi:pterin 4 alpha carbinolamine dehydratase-domain-containing protein [Melampsora americana]|nr:pterin 4 alpha carbinolamine dehydratase-domain-containing protein [Melampsora americana]